MTAGIFKNHRLLAILLLGCCVLVVFITPSGAQTDSEPASNTKDILIEVRGLDDDPVYRKNVDGKLEIWPFHKKLAPSLSRLRFLHRQAPDQIKAALRPFGFYQAEVKAELTDIGRVWQAVYTVTPGDRIKLGSQPIIALNDVSVDCDDFRYEPYDIRSLLPDIKVEDEEFNKHKELVIAFCAARDKANLRKGEPLDQQAYEALKQKLQTTASRLGYFNAEFTEKEIRIDIKSYTASVTLRMTPGERYRVGEATLTQDRNWISTELLDRYVEIEGQDYFDANALQSLQSDLTSSEYYKRVDVKAAVQDATDLEIPVQVDLTHIKPREYIIGLGFGTDTGARARLGVTGRRVNTRGHQYLVEGRVSQIGAGLAAEYTIPTGDPRTDSYGVNLQLEREDSDERDFRSIGLGGSYGFRDELWFKSYALDYSVEEFVLGDDTTTTTLLVPSLEWTRTFPAELEKRINAVNGTRLQLSLRGASESLLSDTTFIQPGVSIKWVSSFENRHRLIGRASAGTTLVDDFDRLPVSLRYFTGGDSTVRGYSFQAIAPVGEDNETQGGRHLLEASLEYEIPIVGNFSGAVFSDIGDAFDDSPDLRLGIGAGLRWRSPIGPVRIDVARSQDEPGEGNYHLHFSLGPDL